MTNYCVMWTETTARKVYFSAELLASHLGRTLTEISALNDEILAELLLDGEFEYLVTHGTITDQSDAIDVIQLREGE